MEPFFFKEDFYVDRALFICFFFFKACFVYLFSLFQSMLGLFVIVEWTMSLGAHRLTTNTFYSVDGIDGFGPQERVPRFALQDLLREGSKAAMLVN